MQLQDTYLQEHNEPRYTELLDDYDHLGSRLERRGLNIDAITREVMSFSVALPSWGVGVGGTRFARFPLAGEPSNIFEKIDDCAVIHQLCRSTPRISPHFPWDLVDDIDGLRTYASNFGLSFDAVNSNTFQDLPSNNGCSYKFGSLTHTDQRVRERAIEHNVMCIEAGRKLGSNALTVWIADGANFPGQQNVGRALDRYLQSMEEIYRALPENWSLFIEHKLFEPAFYSTVISDWGTSYACAQHLGPKASCLVDLGHHAPTTNVEGIVARLIFLKSLGGFHFNDSKYGDDDLDTGSIDPFRLFLVFNELVDGRDKGLLTSQPAYMIDQSHNITDPIESLVLSALEIRRNYARALLVDRTALSYFQETNDPAMAAETLRSAFRIDVEPILAMAAYRQGGAIAPISAYRESGYRKAAAAARKTKGSSAGII